MLTPGMVAAAITTTTSTVITSTSSSSSSYFSTRPSLLLLSHRRPLLPSPPPPHLLPLVSTPSPPPSTSLTATSTEPRFRLVAQARQGGSEDEEVKGSGSGSTARERRLIKVREEKRKREYDRIHNYPDWAKVLENACKDDFELREILGDTIGNPERMKQRVLDRVRKKGRDFHKSQTGSVLPFKVSFRDFNPLDSYIWFELYAAASDRDITLIGNVIQAWYLMGRLGAFNSDNLQLADQSMDYNPLYDSEKAARVLPASFHDISDAEFQDNWGRFWVDIGTADYFAIDVLLNCLTVLSSEYLGIKQVALGGRKMGDWDEGMTSPEYGYKTFKI